MPFSIKRVGIYGGAFDPPHLGHAVALSAFCGAVRPDRTFVIPTGEAPHKTITHGAEPCDRLAMARLAFEGVSPSVVVSDAEISSPEISYTYRTLENLRGQYPEAEFFLFIGTDQFLAFETWRSVDKILRECTVCVMDRYESDSRIAEKKVQLEREFGGRFLILDEKAYIISSTEIRSQLKEKGYSDSLSDPVNDYIAIRGLYRAKDEKREAVLQRLTQAVSTERLAHILSAERETDRFCEWLDVPKKETEELRLAALLHDLTKENSPEEEEKIRQTYGVTPDWDDLRCKAALHGLSASLIAEHEFSLSENAVSAIRYHTTGRAEMSTAEKILYLADFTEPTRSHKICRLVREEWMQNKELPCSERKAYLDHLVMQTMRRVVDHVKEKGEEVHPNSLKALAWMERKETE